MTASCAGAWNSTEVSRMLSAPTTQWPHRMCWLKLAEAADAGTQPHRGVIERQDL